MPKFLKSIEEVSVEHLSCRTYGHAWTHQNDTELIEAGGRVIQYTEMTLCLRCSATRRRTISLPSFGVVTSSIRYPEGYLFAKGKAPEGGRRVALSEKFHRQHHNVFVTD